MKTKQIVLLDVNGDIILLDGGTVHECSDGIVVNLTLDATKDKYSLKRSESPSGVRIEDDKLLFVV